MNGVSWSSLRRIASASSPEMFGRLKSERIRSHARRFSAWDQVFAGIIVIIALALTTYQLMSWAKRRLYPWETQQ